MKIAVCIPCYNEEIAICHVVKEFKKALPEADIWVYDNNSKDGTEAAAREAGALIGRELQQGKGNVVRRMFADIDADIYVLVDGDNTYEATAAPKLVETLVENNLDMVTGSRVSDSVGAYRPGHRFGNWMLTSIVATIFGKGTKDMLSGYRVFSRRFVKSFPALSRGFEIETELTVHALELCMPIAEVDTIYGNRLPGSTSKLSTIKDGIRILRLILSLVKEERPFQFFGIISLLGSVISLSLGYSIFVEFLQTGLVQRFPTAILSASIMILSFLAFISGIILDTVSLGRREMKHLHYLSLPAPKVSANGGQ